MYSWSPGPEALVDGKPVPVQPIVHSGEVLHHCPDSVRQLAQLLCEVCDVQSLGHQLPLHGLPPRDLLRSTANALGMLFTLAISNRGQRGWRMHIAILKRYAGVGLYVYTIKRSDDRLIV